MSNSNTSPQEKLKTIIEYAVKNGYESWWTPYYKRGKDGIKVKLVFEKTLEGLVVQITNRGDVDWDSYCKGGLLDWSEGWVVAVLKPESLLFSHPFAKAVFGEELVYQPTGEKVFNGEPNQRVAMLHPALKAYLYHLQAAVISESVIDYFFDYISNRVKPDIST